jgi:hypothetical protein
MTTENVLTKGHFVIAPGDAKPSTFNPLIFARKSPEFLVQLLEQSAGVTLEDKPKQALFTVLAGLPENASMRDLLDAITVQEAASLGMTVEQYEALSPLLMALQQMQSQGLYAALLMDKPSQDKT